VRQTAVGDGSACRDSTALRNALMPKQRDACGTGEAGGQPGLAARRSGMAQSQRDERLPHARTHLQLLALGTRGLTHAPPLFDVRFDAEATVEYNVAHCLPSTAGSSLA